MAQMNVIVEFYTLNCFECGGLFAVTLKHFTNHKKYGRAVCCPSCKHENFYLSDEERDKDEKDAADLATARAEIVALKSRVVELRHLIEQAEARQQPKEPTTPGAVQPNADDARPVLRRTASGRWCCPHCTATFKKCVSAQFFRHLRRKHDDDVTPGLLDTGGVDRFQVLPAVATAGGAL